MTTDLGWPIWGDLREKTGTSTTTTRRARLAICGALRQGAAGRHPAGQWCLDTGGRARVCAAALCLHLVHTSSTPDRSNQEAANLLRCRRGRRGDLPPRRRACYAAADKTGVRGRRGPKTDTYIETSTTTITVRCGNALCFQQGEESLLSKDGRRASLR